MDQIALISGLLACLFYGLGTYQLVQGLRGDGEFNRSRMLSIASLAIIAHSTHVHLTLWTPDGLQLGVISIAALFTLVVTCLGTAICLFRKIEPLLAPAYPLALLSLLPSIFYSDTVLPRHDLQGGIIIHILASIIAYSVMTLAFSQAVLLWVQNYQLKHRHIHDILKLLPPLQTMESMLFDLVSIGFLLLIVTIGSGFIYVDDLFAQHLVHKTFFTLAATGVFGVLLLGRFLWGWRGMIAARWTLTGFALLLVGYFGSKVVLEVILAR